MGRGVGRGGAASTGTAVRAPRNTPPRPPQIAQSDPKSPPRRGRKFDSNFDPSWNPFWAFFDFSGVRKKIRTSTRKWSRFGAGNEEPETLILNNTPMVLVVFRPPRGPENGAKMIPKRGPEFGRKRGLGKTRKGPENETPEAPRPPHKRAKMSETLLPKRCPT